MRIISGSTISPFLLISIFFIFANIIFQQTAIKITLLVLLTLCVGLTAFDRIQAPDGLRFLANFGRSMTDRLRIFPYEALLIAGIIYVLVAGIVKPPVDMWYPLSSSLLLLFAFVTSALGNKAKYSGHHGFRSIWEVLVKPMLNFQVIERHKGDADSTASTADQENELDLESFGEDDDFDEALLITDDPIMESSVSDAALSDWEIEHNVRWTDWINEEMGRLSGK